MSKSTLTFLIYISICILALKCSAAKDRTINIACASNMYIAMDSITITFELETGLKTNLISQSSGMLYTQINKGAPIDIFISANPIYAEALHKEKKSNPPTPFASGKLILATQKHIDISQIYQLATMKTIHKIGIPNPINAPYGIAAKKHLISLNTYHNLKDKLVIGENESQISQYLKTGAIDAGFIGNSFKVKNGKFYNYLELSIDKLTDLEHCVSQIKNSPNPKNAALFINFLSSQKSKDILSHFGYRNN